MPADYDWKLVEKSFDELRPNNAAHTFSISGTSGQQQSATIAALCSMNVEVQLKITHAAFENRQPAVFLSKSCRKSQMGNQRKGK